MKIHCIVLYRNLAYSTDSFNYSILLGCHAQNVLNTVNPPLTDTRTLFSIPLFPLISHVYKLVKFTPLSCLILSHLFGLDLSPWMVKVGGAYLLWPSALFCCTVAIRKLPDRMTLDACDVIRLPDRGTRSDVRRGFLVPRLLRPSDFSIWRGVLRKFDIFVVFFYSLA